MVVIQLLYAFIKLRVLSKIRSEQRLRKKFTYFLKVPYHPYMRSMVKQELLYCDNRPRGKQVKREDEEFETNLG